MKIWVETVLVGVVAAVGIAYLAINAEEPADPRRVDGARPWSELCEITDCTQFPRGQASFVMTNGDTLYTKIWHRKPRCCGTAGKVFFDPETDTHVFLDAEKVVFSHRDLEQMNGTKGDVSRAAEMYFTSSEQFTHHALRQIGIVHKLLDPDDLSINIESFAPVTYAPDFLLFYQSTANKSAYSLISRTPDFLGHRVAVNCDSFRCGMTSFDFAEGPGKIGVKILKAPDRQTIPGFYAHCDETQTIQTCPAFSKNVETYKDFLTDIGALYVFLKTHPDERVSHVRN